MLEPQQTGDKYSEPIHGYTHFLFSVEVENLLVTESIGQQFKVNKNLHNDKASKIKKEQLKVKLLEETETNHKTEEGMCR
jgi:hypothetical protein